MAREHAPIQIGLPPEEAWRVDRPMPATFLAFVAGDELPDPGDAFLAARAAFGREPTDVEPLPHEDARVAWGFAFRVARRAHPVLVWCERADGSGADGEARDARWVLFVESLLERAAPVDDAVALAGTVADAAGGRLRLLLDPGLGLVWSADEARRAFVADTGELPRGTTVDEHVVYRVETIARASAGRLHWIRTIGLERVGRPELEMIEVPAALAPVAAQLVDALAARFVGEDPPHAGVPFEAGGELRVALVPLGEYLETVASDVVGGPGDRRPEPGRPRAVVAAAGRRGTLRPVWVAPVAELERLARNETGLFLTTRAVEVRERLARATWEDFASLRARRSGDPALAFVAKVARAHSEAGREHVWIEVDSADRAGGTGTLVREPGPPERIAFSRDDVGDWRVAGPATGGGEIGPDRAALLGSLAG